MSAVTRVGCTRKRRNFKHFETLTYKNSSGALNTVPLQFKP
jgi:hypothetical protein